MKKKGIQGESKRVEKRERKRERGWKSEIQGGYRNSRDVFTTWLNGE